MFESNWKMVTRIDSLLRSVIAINQNPLIISKLRNFFFYQQLFITPTRGVVLSLITSSMKLYCLIQLISYYSDDKNIFNN